MFYAVIDTNVLVSALLNIIQIQASFCVLSSTDKLRR